MLGLHAVLPRPVRAGVPARGRSSSPPFFAPQSPTTDELDRDRAPDWLACMALVCVGSWDIPTAPLASARLPLAWPRARHSGWRRWSRCWTVDSSFTTCAARCKPPSTAPTSCLALNRAAAVPFLCGADWRSTGAGHWRSRGGWRRGSPACARAWPTFAPEGDQTRVPHFLALLAEGYLAAGRAEEGLAAIAEALEIVERSG